MSSIWERDIGYAGILQQLLYFYSSNTLFLNATRDSLIP